MRTSTTPSSVISGARETEGHQGDCARHGARLRPSREGTVRHRHDRAGGAAPPMPCSSTPRSPGGTLLSGHSRAERPPVVVCGVLPLPLPSRDTAPFGTGLPPARWLNRPRNAALAAVGRRVLANADRVAESSTARCTVATSRAPWSTGSVKPMPSCSSPSRPSSTPAPTRLSRSFRWAAECHRFGGPASGLVARSRRVAARRASHAGHRGQCRLSTTHRAGTRGPGRSRMCWSSSAPAVAQSTHCHRYRPTRARPHPPYDELLPRTSVFATNGGYGGVQYALRYGVPIVATGGKEDKPEVGARVAWSGVGRRIRSERPSATALRRALLAVLDEPRYRQASQRIAEQMAAASGFAGLAKVVDELSAAPRPKRFERPR